MLGLSCTNAQDFFHDINSLGNLGRMDSQSVKNSIDEFWYT